MFLHFLHSSCEQSSQNAMLLCTAGKSTACCMLAASLLARKFPSDPLAFPAGHRYPERLSASAHHFPPSPYAQPFVPIPASSSQLCLCDRVPGSGLNPITEMIKAERNFISKGYFHSWWLQQYSSAVSRQCLAEKVALARQESRWWLCLAEGKVLWHCCCLAGVCQRGFRVRRVGDPEDLPRETSRRWWGRVRRTGRKVEMKVWKLSGSRQDWECCQNGDGARGAFTGQGESWASNRGEGCWGELSHLWLDGYG